MANLQTKIEKLGLAPRVSELLTAGVVHGSKIAEALRAEGYSDISAGSVNRFLAKVRNKTTPLAAEIFEKHVQREMPKDLDALEELESLCLGWAREAEKDIKQRVAETAVALPGEIERWGVLLEEFNSPDKSKRVSAAAAAIEVCLGYLTRDARSQEKRIQAINQAVKIIELKLRQAGVLTDDDKGRIVILDRQDKAAPATTGQQKINPAAGQQPQAPAFRPYVVKTSAGQGGQHG